MRGRKWFRPRPEYQAPETVETQGKLELDVQVGRDGAPAEPLDWPSDLKTRAQAVRTVMTPADEPLTVDPDGGRDQLRPPRPPGRREGTAGNAGRAGARRRAGKGASAT